MEKRVQPLPPHSYPGTERQRRKERQSEHADEELAGENGGIAAEYHMIEESDADVTSAVISNYSMKNTPISRVSQSFIFLYK
jgi:hypothetical protein